MISILICNSSPDLQGKVDVAVVNMASTSSFAPPKLADFILTERLGSGTYATVYKAYRKVILWCSQAETSEKSRNVSYCYCKFSLVFVQTESES